MLICTPDIVVGLFYIILCASTKAFGLVKLMTYSPDGWLKNLICTPVICSQLWFPGLYV